MFYFFQLTLFPHLYFLLWQKDASRQSLKLHLQVQRFRGIRIRDANTDSSLMPGSLEDGSGFLVPDICSSFSGELHLVNVNPTACVSIPLILQDGSSDPTSFHKWLTDCVKLFFYLSRRTAKYPHHQENHDCQRETEDLRPGPSTSC